MVLGRHQTKDQDYETVSPPFDLGSAAEIGWAQGTIVQEMMHADSRYQN